MAGPLCRRVKDVTELIENCCIIGLSQLTVKTEYYQLSDGAPPPADLLAKCQPISDMEFLTQLVRRLRRLLGVITSDGVLN